METVYFNDLRFSRNNKNCYFRNATTKERLHRYVWKYYNGDIPEGYDIHHIDGDKGNNDISNLQMLSVHEHQRLHADKLTDKQREWRRNNLNENARPKAIEWHKSESGKSWHKEHIRKQHENGSFKKSLICTNCGKEFIGESKGGNSFCSGACKSMYRRKSYVDNIDKLCPVCSTIFKTNKYRPNETCSRSCANRYRWIKNESKKDTENE